MLGIRWKVYCLPLSSKEWIPNPNYEGFYHIVRTELVDTGYKFISMDVRDTGSASDAHMYNNCELNTYSEEGSLGFLAPERLPSNNQDIPYFFIGDNA